MPRRLQALAERRSSLPLVLLAALCVVSVAARTAWLGAPCHEPCRGQSGRVLIFDERYYVNAARVIAGIHPPNGSPYADSPLGVDPNAEHPQLAKLVMAGSIELFGDGPFAWRIGSVVLGTLAILGLFALVRAARGGRWLALVAAALMAADNLMIVQGRIATLDVYALAAMVWAAVAYLRGRPLLAGALIGIGLCTKLVAGYLLFVLVALEALRWWRTRERAAQGAARVGGATLSAAGVFIGLLAVMDRIAPPYDDTAHKRVTGGPFAHFAHMVSYAAHQTSPHGPTGIASYPWGWLVDYKPIVYLNVNPARPIASLLHVHPSVHFLALISPVILLLALPGLVLAGRTAARERAGSERELAFVALAWFVGTFLPFVLLSVVWGRTSYLYYMLIVMPGLYLAAALLLARVRPGPRLTWLLIACIVASAVIPYPLTPLP